MKRFKRVKRNTRYILALAILLLLLLPLNVITHDARPVVAETEAQNTEELTEIAHVIAKSPKLSTDLDIGCSPDRMFEPSLQLARRVNWSGHSTAYGDSFTISTGMKRAGSGRISGVEHRDSLDRPYIHLLRVPTVTKGDEYASPGGSSAVDPVTATNTYTRDHMIAVKVTKSLLCPKATRKRWRVTLKTDLQSRILTMV